MEAKGKTETNHEAPRSAARADLERIQERRKIELSRVIRARAAHLIEEDGNADDAELLRVPARILDGKDVLRAFGSPGDWGYDTPIGNALMLW